ncbi:MAG: glucose-6-phosphate 1-dehydrogenase [Pseudomonadota bacterium]
MSSTETCIYIFGGTGDLSFRKLLPALYMAHMHGRLPEPYRFIAVGRQALSREAFLNLVESKSRAFVQSQNLVEEHWESFKNKLSYVEVDLASQASYRSLAVGEPDQALRVFYLATAPSLFTSICRGLQSAGLVNAQARVVLEKPLGHNLASAEKINQEVAEVFAENQIYRIDHYLGKETVQNLMVLRFANAILEPIWRAPFIKGVQITVAESVGVGSRAGFYDGTGALRDMVQNHLLQLLCIVAMEPPISLDPDDVRDEKRKVLRSLAPMTPIDVKTNTVRGQYRSGYAEGKPCPAYHDEEGVPEGSETETFVAIKAGIQNARWAGVPFFLRTGKRLPTRRSEIIIEFADMPFSIFHDGDTHPNRLVITLQPEESIRLQMVMKEPGSGMNRRPVDLNLDLESAFTARRAEAYERLLVDVVKGRLTHFMRRDELEAAWSWIDQIQEGWRQMKTPPKPYNAGSWGPASSSALAAGAGIPWHEET